PSIPEPKATLLCSSRIVAPRPFDRSNPCTAKRSASGPARSASGLTGTIVFRRLGVKVDDHRCPNLIFRVQKIHDEILALNISEFAQASVKCGVDWYAGSSAP